MLVANKVFEPRYSAGLVYSLLLARKVRQLSEITEKLYVEKPAETAREYNAGVLQFMRENGTGGMKRLGLLPSGIYVAEFRHAKIYQTEDEDFGTMEIICPFPELN